MIGKLKDIKNHVSLLQIQIDFLTILLPYIGWISAQMIQNPDAINFTPKLTDIALGSFILAILAISRSVTIFSNLKDKKKKGRKEQQVRYS